MKADTYAPKMACKIAPAPLPQLAAVGGLQRCMGPGF